MGDCDHVPLMATVTLQLKRIKKARLRVRKKWKAFKTNGEGEKNYKWSIKEIPIFIR